MMDDYDPGPAIAIGRMTIEFADRLSRLPLRDKAAWVSAYRTQAKRIRPLDAPIADHLDRLADDMQEGR